MTCRVSSENKEKKAKRKNSVLKKRPNRKKKRYKETENSVAGSRTRFICTCKKLRGTQRQFSENICSEDDLRSRIFGTFVVKFCLLACLS